MSTALAVADKLKWCESMSASLLLPEQYRKRPADLLWALEFAESVDVHPMTAITGIHSIKGKPCASADLIAALVRRAGHKLRITGDDRQATAQIVRADDPAFDGFRVTWTLDRAKQAGLAGKDVWRQFPAAMLRARAITEVARMAASETLYGVTSTPEELGAVVDADGEPVVEVVQSPPPPPAVRESEPVPPPAPAPERRDWITEARLAPTRTAVQDVYRAARAARADQNTLDCLAEVGRAKPAPQVPAPQPAQPPPPSPPQPESVPPAASQGPPDPHAALRAEVRELLRTKNGTDLVVKPATVDTAAPDALERVAAVLRLRCTKRQSEYLASLCEQAGADVNALRRAWGVRSRAYLTEARCSELIGEYEAKLHAPPPELRDPQEPGYDDVPFPGGEP